MCRPFGVWVRVYEFCLSANRHILADAYYGSSGGAGGRPPHEVDKQISKPLYIPITLLIVASDLSEDQDVRFVCIDLLSYLAA